VSAAGPRRSPSLRDLVVIRLGVAVNLVIGQVAAALLLPVYLDTIGTVLVAALVGPRAAIVAGLTSQVLNAVLSGNFTWLPFGAVQIVIALYAAAAARLGAFRRLRAAIPAGLGLGLVAASTSAPISYFLFGGVTAGGVTAVTTVLRALGAPLPVAVAAASYATDLLDKTLVFALVAVVLRSLPRQMAVRFPMVAR
jgi:energy-coupling factor transport system substrate-specific component